MCYKENNKKHIKIRRNRRLTEKGKQITGEAGHHRSPGKSKLKPQCETVSHPPEWPQLKVTDGTGIDKDAS